MLFDVATCGESASFSFRKNFFGMGMRKLLGGCFSFSEWGDLLGASGAWTYGEDPSVHAVDLGIYAAPWRAPSTRRHEGVGHCGCE
jgi:hypothetical protein